MTLPHGGETGRLTVVTSILDTDDLRILRGGIYYRISAETLAAYIVAENTTTKELTFADSPYTVLVTDEYLTVDTSGGDVIINLLAKADAFKPLWIDKNEISANTVDVTTTVASDKINGADVFPLAGLNEGYFFLPYPSQYKAQ